MNHIDRLNKAIEYIEANLDKHIELALLAAEFALSKYHFHRIFKALIGDTPSKYIEKRRLSRAASDLVHANKRIVDIAFEYGFNAHESFTRSFKKHYSLTPSQFRKKRPDVRIYQQSRLAAVDLKLANGKVQLNPDIIHISGLTVAGLTYSGNDKHEIYSLWQRFWGMVQEGKHYDSDPGLKKATSVKKLPEKQLLCS
jgi:AraC-like DNA-binding protein